MHKVREATAEILDSTSLEKAGLEELKRKKK
jgi:hypothetical protein